MSTQTQHRPLHEVAKEILQDWKNPSAPAIDSLQAMHRMDQVTEEYYADSGLDVVTYALCRFQGWRGEVARKVKAELKEIEKIGIAAR